MKGKYISWMPLYCKQAWGKFYGVYPWGYPYPHPPGAMGTRIFQRIPTAFGIKTYSRCYFKPTNPKSSAQLKYRGWWGSGVKKWQGLTDDDKEIYNAYRYPPQCSGFNKFLHYYMLDK